jgi:hypothetical protein
MAIDLQSMGIGLGAGLNGIAGASLTPAPVGVRAQSPTLPQLNNSLPKTQAVNDLSSTYGKSSNGTIYKLGANGTPAQAFSNANDFYKDSGLSSFNNTKFSNYTPTGSESIYGQTPAPTPAPTPATQTPTPAPTSTGNYTPPNQGTTGVSQGGIVGNLLNQGNGQQSQAVTDATNALKTDEQQQASQIAAYGGVGDSNLALGRTGLVNQLYASKIVADQAAVQNALTSQGQQFGQTTAAASANAPIVSNTGQAITSPTNPNSSLDITGGSSSLNPLNSVSSLAQKVIIGQMSYADAVASGGSVSNFQSALNSAIAQTDPNYNYVTGQASAAGQAAVTLAQTQQKAQYTSAYQQTTNLGSQLNNLISTFGLNPSDINAVNAGLQKIAQQTSGVQYQELNNYINDVASRYAQILTPLGGTSTDTSRSIASSMLNNTMSGQGIAGTLAGLDQQAQAVIAGVITPAVSNGGSSSTISNSSSASTVRQGAF